MTAPAARQQQDLGTMIATVLLIGIGLALVATVFGEVTVPFAGTAIELRYKTLWRTLPIVWLASLLLPAARPALSCERTPSDLPLGLFTLVAALATALGGDHWGDWRNLVAAIGVGFMARALFAPTARRRLFVHYLGLTVLMVIARELWVHPGLLPPHETGRYELITANPNVLGFLFAMIVPLVAAEALASNGGRRACTAGYLGAAFLGLVLTFSRTAATGAAAGAAVLLLGGLPRRRAIPILLLSVVVLVAVQRPDQWTKLRTTGDAQRVRILATSLTLAAESPVLGVGYGINNLEDVFPDRYEDRYGSRVFRFHSMNQVVDLLVGTGITGTILALWWAARVGGRARDHFRDASLGADRLRAAGALAACVAIAVMSMGEPPLYHGKIVPILFLVLAIVELGPALEVAEKGPSASLLPRSLAVPSKRVRRG